MVTLMLTIADDNYSLMIIVHVSELLLLVSDSVFDLSS